MLDTFDVTVVVLGTVISGLAAFAAWNRARFRYRIESKLDRIIELLERQADK